jgi:tetratricopeptide (TPR) repeat protein
LTALLLTTLVLPAAAWGPKTQLAISSAALHLISKEGNLPLSKMADSVRRGAMESQATITALYPDMQSGPIQAIETEIVLLKSMRGDKLDNYFAYRMGLLGKLVAQITAPMAEANPTYRNLYYTDVERVIESTSVTNLPAKSVDSADYFARCLAEANANNDVIEREYESGIGIGGVAKSLLGADTSRSARAVADVWATILTAAEVTGNVAPDRMREYCLHAMRFYIDRDVAAAMAAAEVRYEKLVAPDANYLVALGDAYFGAGYNDQAIGKYKAALQLAPERRDVANKISDFYMAKGAADLENGQLEAAEDAFAAALASNPLHNSAEGSRLQVARMIEDRDARLAANQAALDRAAELERLADEEALRKRAAEAIDLLRGAESAYMEVTDEFPLELSLRERGLGALRIRVQELKQQIMVNAENFSGTGYVQDVPRLVQTHGTGLDEAGLKSLLQREYDAEYDAVAKRLEEALRVN